jgi:inosose dehydratase
MASLSPELNQTCEALMTHEASLPDFSFSLSAPSNSGSAGSLPGQRFRIGQATTAHLFVEASVASFWRGVEDLAGLGFHGTEADNMLAHLSDEYGERIKEFGDLMVGNKMHLPALYHVLAVNDASRRRDNIEEGMRVGKFIHQVGGGVLNLAGGKRRPECSIQEEVRVLAEVVDELGKRLREECGVRLCYHPEVGLIGQNREELARIMDATNPECFSLCPDTAHLLAGGCDLVEVFRTYRSRIIHVHYKDFDFNWHNDDVTKAGLRGGFVELGAGVVDFPALTDLLVSSGYSGWVMLEVDPPRLTPLETAQKNAQYVLEKLKLTIA